jgi:hypothetical protein
MASVMSVSSDTRFVHALAEDLPQFQILVLTRFPDENALALLTAASPSHEARLRGESRHFMMIYQFGDALLRNLH